MMRIKPLAILFVVGVVASPAAAQTSSHLPEFVSPAAREDVTKAAREADANSVETRKAAEALSAKFSALPGSAADAPVTQSANKTPEDSDPPAKSETSARVAVLVAERPKPKKKASLVKQATLAGPTHATRARVVEHRKIKAARRPIAEGPETSAPGVPNAKAGWQTGLIGFLTNPAFWH